MLASLIFGQVANGKTEKQETDGAKIYGSVCVRCHRAPEPTQRSSAGWQTIMLHMRVRAHLTKNEASSVLAFMKKQVQPLVIHNEAESSSDKP